MAVSLFERERAEGMYSSDTKERAIARRAQLRCRQAWAAPAHRRIRYEPPKTPIHRYEHSGIAIRDLELAKRKSLGIKELAAANDVRPEVPRAVLSTAQRMVELLDLPHGWNSYSARPITAENISFAIGVLAQIMGTATPPPHVVPMVRGGVQLEWHTRGVNLEISIYSPNEVNFVAEDLRHNLNAEAEFSVDAVRDWVNRLSR